MRYNEMREELKSFYWHGDEERSKSFAEKCFKIMDEKATPDMSVAAQKLMQYEVIAEEFEPVIFRNSPFYYSYRGNIKFFCILYCILLKYYI